MSTMVVEVYDALRSIGIAEDKAAKAAEAMAAYDPQIAAISSDVRILRWMVGVLYVPILAILVKLLHG